MKKGIMKCSISSKVEEEENIAPQIKKKAKKRIETQYEKMGLKVEITDLTNPEKFVEEYYRDKNYGILTTEIYNGMKTFQLPESLCEQLASLGEYYDTWTKGCPDFFVYKEIDEEKYDFFFVEVKSLGGGLSYNQIKWIAEHPKIETKVFFVDKKS